MNREELKSLIDKCPKLLKATDSFDCGKGWLVFLDPLCRVIENHINSLPEAEQSNFYLAQCKEKFGGLRFYMNRSDDFIRGAIDLAEAMSVITCEKCSAPGSLRSGGWIRCLCDACHFIQTSRNLSHT